jgi:hypothetical protein
VTLELAKWNPRRNEGWTPDPTSRKDLIRAGDVVGYYLENAYFEIDLRLIVALHYARDITIQTVRIMDEPTAIRGRDKEAVVAGWYRGIERIEERVRAFEVRQP